MNILHVADLHYNQNWFHWISESAPEHDLLTIAGDLLDQNHPASHATQVKWVSDWVRRYDRPVVICSGNHDLVRDPEHHVWWPARWLGDVAGPRAWVDGQTADMDGFRVFSYPACGAPRGQPADAWVVHAPPVGPGVGWRDNGESGGDPTLLSAVAKHQPRIVLCGHVHSPLSWIERFDGVLYLNPGSDARGTVPNHILVDLDDGIVHRVRASGASRSVCEISGGLLSKSTPVRQRAHAPLEPVLN